MEQLIDAFLAHSDQLLIAQIASTNKQLRELFLNRLPHISIVQAIQQHQYFYWSVVFYGYDAFAPNWPAYISAKLLSSESLLEMLKYFIDTRQSEKFDELFEFVPDCLNCAIGFLDMDADYYIKAIVWSKQNICKKCKNEENQETMHFIKLTHNDRWSL